MGTPADFEAHVDAEIGRWPGLRAERRKTKNHHRLVLSFGEASRFVVYPASPGKGRVLENHLATIRRTARQLGAQREDRR